MFVIVEKFPELKGNNFVVDVHDGFERLFYCVVPHQMVYRRKNFWGAEITTMQYGSLKPSGWYNKPAEEKILEYITDVPQTIDEINRQLRADGYNTHFDIDIKAHIYRLKAEDKVITQYNNRVMTVKIANQS